jgi:prophage maintenance system killer protein
MASRCTPMCNRAPHLLYFVIKDHPFSDGNKRIGTLLFFEYLRLNNLLLRAEGQNADRDRDILTPLRMHVSEPAC